MLLNEALTLKVLFTCKKLLNVMDKTYIPTSGHCFIKCIKYLTGKDYTEDL